MKKTIIITIAEYLVNTGGDLNFLKKSTRERVSKEACEALTESIEEIEVEEKLQEYLENLLVLIPPFLNGELV